MFKELNKICIKPIPHSVSTITRLWTDPHIAKKMLACHLDQNSELASRPLGSISKVVSWIEARIGLSDKVLCDLGCGPGLYSQKFAEKGANVIGLDISENSISYAQKSSSLHSTIQYRVFDYLEDDYPKNLDIVTLIYCDLCALSKPQREKLYAQVRQALKPNGHFIFDVFSGYSFELLEESTEFSVNSMGGFWSANDYVCLRNTFKYEEQLLMLDQYTIIEENRSWQVFNWLQYFCHQDLLNELNQNGFEVIEVNDAILNTGRQDEPTVYGVIARPVA